MTESYYHWDNECLVLRIRVQPRAPVTRVSDVIGDRLRIRLTSPPVEGKANEALIRFLARAFRVRRDAVRITAGETARDKTVCIRTPGRLPKAFPGLELST